MKIFTRYIVLSIICFPMNHILAPAWAGGIPCDGPTKLVSVMVKREEYPSLIYSYEIYNLHTLPITIFSLSLGDSNKENMHSIQKNIPKSIFSPKDWIGDVSFTDESIYMRIYWKAKNTVILDPGQSLDGFKLEMPESPIKGIVYHVYGEPVDVIDMRKIHFNVFLENGACIWGVVKEKLASQCQRGC